jgi:Asp-tRNA(Asn)/Glu-tRNA(Gln) amidotransferase A subunit family amidase
VGETTGVQIVAARGRDDLVLAVAAQLEEALR